MTNEFITQVYIDSIYGFGFLFLKVPKRGELLTKYGYPYTHKPLHYHNIIVSMIMGKPADRQTN